MKKISPQQAALLPYAYNSSMSPLRQNTLNEIKALRVGEILLINSTDWDSKNPISGYLSKEKKSGKNFNIKRLQDGAGYVVERTA